MSVDPLVGGVRHQHHHNELAGAVSVQASRLDVLEATDATYDGRLDVLEATVTRREQLPIFDAGAVTAGDIVWPDAVMETLRVMFAVPDDYVSGDLTFRLHRRASVATNTAVMHYFAYRLRAGAALTTIHSAVSSNFTPGNTNTQLITITVAAANFALGDIIRVDLVRLGADAADTLAGVVQYDGGWVEYTGRK